MSSYRLRLTEGEVDRHFSSSLNKISLIEAFLPIIWKYTNITELTPHILNELIEKIVVHEKAVAEDGSKSQQVDTYYKFIGCVNWKRDPASYAALEREALQQLRQEMDHSA